MTTDTTALIVGEMRHFADGLYHGSTPDNGIPHDPMHAQIHAWVDRLAALGADTKRLDWLEGAGTLHLAHWYRTGMRRFVEIVDQDEQQISEGATLRAAIDAARNQEAGK